MARAKFQSSRSKNKLPIKGDATSPANRGRGYGATQLAREIGFSQVYVSQLMKKGVSIAEIKRKAAERNKKAGIKIDPHAGAASTHKFKRGRAPTQVENETFAHATLRKEIAIANQREMEVASRRAELVPRVQIMDWVAGGLVGSKDVLIRLEELGDVMAQELDPAVCRMRIRQEVEQVLGKLETIWRTLAEMADEPPEPERQIAGEEDDG